jgi:hypothetical protein
MSLSFDVQTTRRLAVGLLAVSGGLLFSTFDLIGVGISAGDMEYAAAVSRAVGPLSQCTLIALITFAFAEIAAHPSTPELGHPHSKRNYLERVSEEPNRLGIPAGWGL